MMRTRLIRLALLAGILGTLALPLAAFKFYPISMDFTSSGAGSINNFQAVNDTDQTIALKITVFARGMDEAGKDVLTEAPEAFQVYPARLVLKKDQQQRIRVQFKGQENKTAEQAFRIVVEQVPVEFADQDKTAGLKILFRYIGSLYVLPEKPAPKVVVTGLEQILNINGNLLKLTLENQGNAHVILNKLQIEIKSGGQTVVLGSDQLAGLDASNILPGVKRVITLPWPAGLPVEGLSGKAVFEAAR